jgi:arsenate reductase
VFHWSFDDPAEAQGSDDDRQRVFRRVRDEIADRIRNWLRTEENTL